MVGSRYVPAHVRTTARGVCPREPHSTPTSRRDRMHTLQASSRTSWKPFALSMPARGKHNRPHSFERKERRGSGISLEGEWKRRQKSASARTEARQPTLDERRLGVRAQQLVYEATVCDVRNTGQREDRRHAMGPAVISGSASTTDSGGRWVGRGRRARGTHRQRLSTSSQPCAAAQRRHDISSPCSGCGARHARVTGGR